MQGLTIGAVAIAFIVLMAALFGKPLFNRAGVVLQCLQDKSKSRDLFLLLRGWKKLDSLSQEAYMHLSEAPLMYGKQAAEALEMAREERLRR